MQGRLASCKRRKGIAQDMASEVFGDLEGWTSRGRSEAAGKWHFYKVAVVEMDKTGVRCMCNVGNEHAAEEHLPKSGMVE